MDIYLVGGAVRDELLGINSMDKDWVVVGSSVDAMLAQGFLPVGRDFPVFLHPETHDEYALARTERKSGKGYTGFTFFTDPSVTLEADLSRRDLTINAMAKDQEGRIIDPFGGQKDLALGVLRHIGPSFSEDPVRVLRIARFAARYGFDVAPETMVLMKEMVETGEVSALVPERVWQEVAKGLMEEHPSRMFYLLKECGALRIVMPEVDALFGVPQRADYHPEIDTAIHTLMVLDTTAKEGLSLEERYAALCHDLGKALTPQDILPKHHAHEKRGEAPVLSLNQRLKVPKCCADLAFLMVKWHGMIHKYNELRASTILNTLSSCDGFRRPERFDQILNVCEADAKGRLGFESTGYSQKAQWQHALSVAASVPISDLIQGLEPARIPETIRLARIKAIKAIKLSHQT